jgi:hypothetical protein
MDERWTKDLGRQVGLARQAMLMSYTAGSPKLRTLVPLARDRIDGNSVVARSIGRIRVRAKDHLDDVVRGQFVRLDQFWSRRRNMNPTLSACI